MAVRRVGSWGGVSASSSKVRSLEALFGGHKSRQGELLRSLEGSAGRVESTWEGRGGGKGTRATWPSGRFCVLGLR